MSAEFEYKVLEKLESLERKIDTVNNNLNKKIDEVNDNLNKKIDYVDKKLTKKIDDLSIKLEYTNNNVAKILQEKIKMREEIAKDRKQNNKEHKLYEYEINNLKKYVVG